MLGLRLWRIVLPSLDGCHNGRGAEALGHCTINLKRFGLFTARRKIRDWLIVCVFIALLFEFLPHIEIRTHGLAVFRRSGRDDRGFSFVVGGTLDPPVD